MVSLTILGGEKGTDNGRQIEVGFDPPNCGVHMKISTRLFTSLFFFTRKVLNFYSYLKKKRKKIIERDDNKRMNAQSTKLNVLIALRSDWWRRPVSCSSKYHFFFAGFFYYYYRISEVLILSKRIRPKS